MSTGRCSKRRRLDGLSDLFELPEDGQNGDFLVSDGDGGARWETGGAAPPDSGGGSGHVTDYNNPHKTSLANLANSSTLKLTGAGGDSTLSAPTTGSSALKLPTSRPSSTSLVSLASDGALQHGDQAISHHLSFGEVMLTNQPVGMASNSSGGYTASASSSNGFDEPWNAFDSSASTFWTNSAPDIYSGANPSEHTGSSKSVIGGVTYNGSWLKLDFGSPVTLSSYSYDPRGGSMGPYTFYVGASADDVAYSLWDSRTAVSSSSQSFTPASPVMARYVLLAFTRAQPFASYVGLVRLGFTFTRCSHLPKNLGPPVDRRDAANKYYVDSQTSKTPLTIGTSSIASTGSVALALPSALPAATSLVSMTSAGALQHGNQAISHNLSFVATAYVKKPDGMTSNSWNGLVASASTSGNGNAYDGFNTGSNFSWQSNTSTYNATSGAYTSNASKTFSNVAYPGEWLQLDFGTGVVLQQYCLQAQSSGLDKSPKTWQVGTSLDGTSWTLWHTGSYTFIDGSSITFTPTDTARAARYVAIVVASIKAGGTSSFCAIGHFGFDYTSCPAIKNVATPLVGTDAANKAYVDLLSASALKPPVSLPSAGRTALVTVDSSGNSGTGAATSLTPYSFPVWSNASSNSATWAVSAYAYEIGYGDTWQPWRMFDNITTGDTGFLGKIFYNSSGVYTASLVTGLGYSVQSTNGVQGDWVQLRLVDGTSMRLKDFDWYPRLSVDNLYSTWPRRIAVFGSNEATALPTSWTELYRSGSDMPTWLTSELYRTFTLTSQGYYKVYRFVIESLYVNPGGNGYVRIAEIKPRFWTGKQAFAIDADGHIVIGSTPESHAHTSPLTIGTSTIASTGSVALSLPGTLPSTVSFVSLHPAGILSTSAAASLKLSPAVAAYTMPSNFTSNSTHSSVWSLNRSSLWASSTWEVWRIFDGLYNTGDAWICEQNLYNGGSGAYTGAQSSNGIPGEWFQLRRVDGVPTTLVGFEFCPRIHNPSFIIGPKKLAVLGSNQEDENPTSWTTLYYTTTSEAIWGTSESFRTWTIPTPAAYKVYRWVIESFWPNGGITYCDCAELRPKFYVPGVGSVSSISPWPYGGSVALTLPSALPSAGTDRVLQINHLGELELGTWDRGHWLTSDTAVTLNSGSARKIPVDGAVKLAPVYGNITVSHADGYTTWQNTSGMTRKWFITGCFRYLNSAAATTAMTAGMSCATWIERNSVRPANTNVQGTNALLHSEAATSGQFENMRYVKPWLAGVLEVLANEYIWFETLGTTQGATQWSVVIGGTLVGDRGRVTITEIPG